MRELLGRMERFQGDPADAQQIFDALSGRARANLRARAERYGAASGKKIEPAAMLVPARLALRFAPHRFGAEVDGNHALVTVAGARPAQRATVAGLFEDGAWRVDLVFPELAPLQMRPGSEP
ncbi:MAG: hypothetical protein HY744_12915 [Deltaproteobacteria bacterium]|nr:hypothetical protein [Deltaproteobacteria bacterium]